jgi:hypothetical protein
MVKCHWCKSVKGDKNNMSIAVVNNLHCVENSTHAKYNGLYEIKYIFQRNKIVILYQKENMLIYDLNTSN